MKESEIVSQIRLFSTQDARRKGFHLNSRIQKKKNGEAEVLRQPGGPNRSVVLRGVENNLRQRTKKKKNRFPKTNKESTGKGLENYLDSKMGGRKKGAIFRTLL